jgi:hypothetical protein
MLRLSGIDVLLSGGSAARIFIDANDLEVLRLELFAEGLPDRQVETAASPRCPEQ